MRVDMLGICKAFGAVQALDNVCLRVGAGEVLGLVGDNAAGKSTLMKILTGAYKPDAGKILVDHEPVVWQRPEDSLNRGIRMVYQDLALADNLSVSANLHLGRELTRKWGPFKVLDEAAMRKATYDLIHRLQMDMYSAEQVVEGLSGGQRQAVAIGRAILGQTKLLILDEPTSALSLLATRQVLRVVAQLAAAGMAIILISHRLDDVVQAANRVVVLRQGAVVAERVVDKMHPEQYRQGLLDAMEGFTRADKNSPSAELQPYSGASTKIASI